MIKYITCMLFETIINKIKDIKNFSELSEYITSDFLYKKVEEFLKKKGLHINPKMILASFLLKYEIENNLYYPYNDSQKIFNIAEEICKLHDSLIKYLPPHELNNIINEYIKKFKIWKEADKKKIIADLKEDYISLIKRYNDEKNTTIRGSMLLLIDSYKSKLLKLITEEEFNKIEEECLKKRSPQTLKNFMRESYHNYLTLNLKENNIEVVTQNLTELREYILVCTKDTSLIKEMIDVLYIEYLSDEELFKFLYNYCNFLLRITSEPNDVSLIKSIKKKLDNNVSLDTEMYKFIPDILSILFDLMDVLIVEKSDY